MDTQYIYTTCQSSVVQFWLCTYYVEMDKTYWTYSRCMFSMPDMVLIWDGNSEINAHVRSNPCYLICIRHLIHSSQKSDFFFSKKQVSLHRCATYSELPSNTSIHDDSDEYISNYISMLIALNSLLLTRGNKKKQRNILFTLFILFFEPKMP